MCLAMNLTNWHRANVVQARVIATLKVDKEKVGEPTLVSPEMAAAAAVAGRFVDVRDWDYKA